MKIKENYVLKEVAGKYLVVPINEEALNFNGIITLNETGAFLFRLLQVDQSLENLVNQMTDSYHVEAKQAEKDIENIIQQLNEKGLIHW
jgi:hypothetical protein